MKSTKAEWISFPGDTTRDRIEEALRADLVGPSEPDELLSQSPGSRYLAGMLAPSGTHLDAGEDEQVATASSDDASDSDTAIHTALDQSAIGMSFVLAEACSEFRVDITWGEYRVEVDHHESASESHGPADRELQAHFSKKWRRSPHSASEIVTVKETDGMVSIEVGEQVNLSFRIRHRGDAHYVSLFLSNQRSAPAEGGRPTDDLWMFQPSITVSTDEPEILGRSANKESADPDPDVASSELLYRNLNEYATGHGVAAGWEPPSVLGVTNKIWTEIIPTMDVPATVNGGGDDVQLPEIRALAEAGPDELAGLLDPMLDAYEEWLAAREGELTTIPEPHHRTGDAHLKRAKNCLDRMREGLGCLQSNPDALEAFRFANHVMAEQMIQGAHVRIQRGRAVSDAAAGPPRWRLFQIGFVLQSIPGMVDPEHPDREVADLLWFPTGGGKTEAYLALTAFALVWRRLRAMRGQAISCSGTTVVMRYTLRLLTTQQFHRALALICACEVHRLSDPERWGRNRFTIGLWVGQSLTPNNFNTAAESLAALKRGNPVYRENPVQIVHCPWCGHDLTAKNYETDEDREQLLVLCPNDECEFSAEKSELGLPVLLVDSEIYRNPPSLLLATIDKFASMPWNGKIQTLFGRVNSWCSRHGFLSAAEPDHPKSHRETPNLPPANVRSFIEDLYPPELIIQDELHLISGPLGTLAGIYEVAVDLLCRNQKNQAKGPKVIASTATIRRAETQVRALFGREVKVFPPLGLNASDSFFSRQASPEEKPGRRYVGIYAPGKSIKTALVRTYGALLVRAKAEFDADPSDENDSYMTLVCYFNSLRELGGALRLVEDDVPARIKVLNRRAFGPMRRIYEHRELTSRVKSGDIPNSLAALERRFQEREKGRYPLDLVLASNMLSVGVDIDRLSLMVVTGQPKTTAEYIQATSRVGRRYPGLIVTVYNWSRPRDTSHYESFRGYHQALYAQVEATSVTPFSSRARDRALAAVLTSHMRLDTAELAPEKGAAGFASDTESWARFRDEMILRVRQSEGTNRAADEAETELKVLAQEWEDLGADHDSPLVYTARGKGGDTNKRPLLKSLEAKNSQGEWEIPRSLREVEEEIDVVLRNSDLEL